MKKNLLGLILLLTVHIVCAQSLNSHPQINFVCNKGNYVVSEMADNFFPGDDHTNMCIPKSNGIPNGYWYAWTIDHPGSIEFVITPYVAADDIDFELFLQVDGKNQMVRCMASGPNVGTEDQSDHCLGMTGMLEEFSHIKENLGCSPDKSNFTTPAYTMKGQTYLLRVINFSSDLGFEFELKGSAELKGGEKVAIDHQVENDKFFHFEPVTESSEAIASYKWNFGIGAHPKRSAEESPGKIVYDQEGEKVILLETWDEENCYSQSFLTVNVANNQLYSFSKEDLQCFPNPFDELLNVGIPNYHIDSKQSISVWDVAGKLVFEKNVSNEIETLELGHLSAGTYLLKLKTPEEEYVTELIKVNNQGN